MNAVLEVREPSARYLAALEAPLLDQFNLVASAPKGVARLRELILSLAVQGKLVPQDPNDEPASVLLERIRSEKVLLVKEGKIKLAKPLVEVAEDEMPFQVPSGWEAARFGAIAEIERGGSPRPIKDFLTEAPNGLNWIKIGDTDKGGKYITSASEKIRSEGLSKTRMVFPGDFLLTNSMSFGRPYITKIEGCIHDGWLRISPPTSLNKDYLYTLLSSPFIRKLFEDAAAGAVVMNLNADKVRDLPIPLPPLAEQSRIVARVEELMALCDALEAKDKLEAEQHTRLVGCLFESLANSESAYALAENWQRIATHFDLLLDRPSAVDALEQTILQLAVRGLLIPQDPADEPASVHLQKIRNEKEHLIAAGKIKRDKPLPPISDEEKPFELPGGWEWVRLGTVADVASYLVSPEQYQDMVQVAPDCIEKATGYLLERRTVKDAGVTSPNHRFYAGQILYSKIRPSLSKAVVVDFEGLCSADMYPLNSWLDTGYLHRYILSQPFLEQVRTAENRVKMPKLNQEALNSFLVPVPPLTEQSRIVARIAELRELCTKLRQRLTFSQQTQSRLADALVASVAI